MIRIKYRSVHDGHVLIIRGHAGHNPGGPDIVCAAVSAIIYTLAGYLSQYEDISLHMDSGKTFISCVSDNKIDVAFEMALVGLAQVAAAYPGNVTLDISSYFER